MSTGATGFDEYCRRRAQAAEAARLRPMRTVAQDTAGADLVPIGSPWTRRLFDGEFYRSEDARLGSLPAVGLVVGRLPSGHVVTGEALIRATGVTSQHLIHEGLVRVDADAVLGSAASVRGADALFSVWHPEFVAMRRMAGRARHPAQVVVSGTGDLPLDDGLAFQEPSVRVIIITRGSVADSLAARLRERPWIDVIDAGEPLSLFTALMRLRTMGIQVVAAAGGQRTASGLLREGLVTDLYVVRPASGRTPPHTGLYDGPPLLRRRLLSKAGCDEVPGVCFEHLVRPSVFAAAMREAS